MAARRRRKRRRRSRALGRGYRLGAASYCPRPTYGRTLGGTLVGDIVNAAVAVGGAAAGGALMASNRAAGVAVGGAAGYLAGVPLAMMADRAVLRSPDCPNAGLARLFGARLAKGAITGTVITAARAAVPEHARAVGAATGVVALFGTVPLTQAIIRTA